MPLVSAREHIERASAEVLYALSDIAFVQEAADCGESQRDWDATRTQLVAAMTELSCVVKALSNAHRLAALRFEAAAGARKSA